MMIHGRTTSAMLLFESPRPCLIQLEALTIGRRKFSR
jgi:hypothetical protein